MIVTKAGIVVGVAVAVIAATIIFGVNARQSIRRRRLDTALLGAVMSGNVQQAEKLLGQGANIETRIQGGIDRPGWHDDGSTPLALAIRRNNGPMIRMLVGHSANVNAMTERYHDIPPYDIILCPAVRHCDLTTVRVLVEKGANVNTRSGMGVTPVMMAAGNNRPEIVKFLIERGADVNAHDERRFSALSFASGKHRENYSKVIRLLKDAGAR